MPSFAVSISILGLVQAALVALPAPHPRPSRLDRFRSPWWALIPALSIVIVIAAVEQDPDSAKWLSYLALVSVPPLAAYALGALVHGARSEWALVAVALFALAWASTDSLAGEAAATALSGLACVTLGWLLVATVPARWLRLGVYAMATIDAIYVSADLLQAPNAILGAAAPPAGLPSLQAVHFGAAQMGFGDLFVAALVGCLLAVDGTERPPYGWKSSRQQVVCAGLVAVLALGFDLLFFAVDELPATVPIAAALALTQHWWAREGPGQRARPSRF